MTELIIAHWWVFPVAIVFATIAIGSGVSGALVFSPFFLYGVGLEHSRGVYRQCGRESHRKIFAVRVDGKGAGNAVWAGGRWSPVGRIRSSSVMRDAG
jgi:hypothetical protein